MKGKKIGSPQGEQTHTDMTEWADCSLRCESLSDCSYWHWDSSSSTCSTMTGNGLYVDDVNFVGGKKGCNIFSNITGWTTCTELPPYENLPSFKKKQVNNRWIVTYNVSSKKY